MAEGGSPEPSRGYFHRRRQQMVRRDLVGRDIEDRAVLDAMKRVRRERFVLPRYMWRAYEDRPLPIEAGQTISQPYIVAAMAQAAEIGEEDRVLEVGTGSGYGAAVLGCLAAEVWTIERHRSLIELARRHLAAEGLPNVHVVQGDGTLGFEQAQPFDAIVVTAHGPEIPKALLEQLAEGGRLVMPVGSKTDQRLIRIRRAGPRYDHEDLGPVRFVPLIGEQGWPQSDR